jgi:putative RecB family exonuclease
MIFDAPKRLSPSGISSFLECPLAFKFKYIDKLAEPPNIFAVKGLLIHKILEELFKKDLPFRNIEIAYELLDSCIPNFYQDYLPYFDSEELLQALKSSIDYIDCYFAIEQPALVSCIGVETVVELTDSDLSLYGIIDRIDLNNNGTVTIVDYKTGRTPTIYDEKHKMVGVNFYALLYWKNFGILPEEIKLLYLKEKTILSSKIDETSIEFTFKKIKAIAKAIQLCCETGRFMPKQSFKCQYCFFQKYCPLYGGDPEVAKVELSTRVTS